jgi:predicted SPOUT superfamily RNA methylase MTH1
MSTYSFINVQATFSGPDGTYPIGSGSGVTDEGITIEMLDDKDKMDVGADGVIMHSLRASNACRVTVRLLKTSAVNAQLMASYNFQKAYAGNWGQNIIKVSDTFRGDIETVEDCAFSRQPTIAYTRDAALMEWQFLGSIPAAILGVGQPEITPV